MKLKFLLLLSILTVFSISPVTSAYFSENAEKQITTKLQDPIKVLEIFFKAVKQGNLVVLGKKIEKSLLVPIQIEYIYKFDGQEPRVKIYSELKYPLAVEAHKGIRIIAVSAIINNEGDIIEIAAHVTPDN